MTKKTIAELDSDVTAIRADFTTLRTDISSVRSDVTEFKTSVTSLEQQNERIMAMLTALTSAASQPVTAAIAAPSGPTPTGAAAGASGTSSHTAAVATFVQTTAPPPPPPSAALIRPPPTTFQSSQISLPLLHYEYPPPVGVNSQGVPVYSNVEVDGAYRPQYQPPATSWTTPIVTDAPLGADSTLSSAGLVHQHGSRPPDRGWLPGPEYRLQKLQMPLFDGTDASGWVFRAERYFGIHGFTTDNERLRVAVICLEGQALSWFRYTEQQIAFRSWNEFKARLLDRFQPSFTGSIHDHFLTLQQDGTVRDYISLFETVAAQLRGVPAEIMESTFIKGLLPDIRATVRLMQPIGLMQAMRTAILVEESRMTGSSQPGRAVPTRPNPTSSSRPPPFTNKPNSAAPVTTAATTKPTLGMRKPLYKRLTDSEMADKRAKGLCYRCDGKFSPGHRCPEKYLQILVVDDELEVTDEEEEEEEPIAPENVEVSAHSVAGFTSPKTMKLRGVIKDREVVILIDSGATHNFISRRLLAPLKLEPTGTRATGVKLGNGTTETSHGICMGVTLTLPGVTIIEDFYPLELGGTDVILGIKWLRELGDVRVNWQTLSMTFDHDGTTVTLHGDPSLHHSASSLRALLRGLSDTTESYWIELLGAESSQTDVAVPNSTLQGLIHEFADVFDMPTGLPPPRGHEHAITLRGGTEPINVRPYRYPQLQKDAIEKLVGEMLEAGIIQPSSSPFSSPVLLVKKKDGSWRFCVDYRALNKATILDKFPIPVIDELLDELHGATIFSKLDLKSGYHQILMKETDVHKTAFRTHEGHYEFLVMPFGLTNAPSTFQALMNRVFKPYLRKFVLVFFDDILVYSPSIEEHREHLRVVFDLLRKERLYCNQKKCVFGQTKVEYLGHVVTGDGVQADTSKIQAMLDWPIPKTIRELRGFLGLTGYYRKFVKDYGKIAKPLTELLKKEGFTWSQEATESFQRLQTAMTEVPVLALPNFEKPFTIETDASGVGVGAVMMQEGRPIAFFSQALGPRARAKSVYERELMAIVLAVQKWRPYLLGRKFRVITDQKSLKFLLEQRTVPGEHQKWVAKLSGYDFDIVYRAGRENGAADALSRRGHEPTLHALITCDHETYAELRQDLIDDPNYAALKSKIATNGVNFAGYVVDDNLVFFRDRLVLPEGSPWTQKLIREVHESPLGGHEGVAKTYHRLAREFFWTGMKKDVAKVVAECVVCQRQKYSTLAPAGLLQPLSLPDRVWDDITMDFIDGLPKSGGFSAIFVVVDRLSKYAHFIALKHPYTAPMIASVFVREVVRLHGIPKSIVSDRDKIFLSKFWRELFKGFGTKLKYSTAYHPQTDGQTEVVNRSLETYLRCFVSEKPKDWIRWLPWAEFWYNTSHHSTIGTTPFKVLYGRDPPSLLLHDRNNGGPFEVDRYLQERDEVLSMIRDNFLRAQQRMKAQADGARREVTFEIGDKVFLKLRPYRQGSVVYRSNRKLAARYYGPYEIIERIGEVAYRLQLPATARIHPVFHVSQLKKAIGNQFVETTIPDLVDVEDSPSPREVLGTREVNGMREVLIAWDGQTEEEATWETFDSVCSRFPYFHLEDKVTFRGGSDDTIAGSDAEGGPKTDGPSARGGDSYRLTYHRKKYRG